MAELKKQIYNDNSAVGPHSKKLIIGDGNMSSDIGGIGFTNMGAIGGGTAGRIVVGSTSDGSDSNCKDCARKEICKYVSYYAELVEIANQISIDSNFGLRLWCKNYKSKVDVRG